MSILSRPHLYRLGVNINRHGYWCAIVAALLLLFVDSLVIGGPTWDELAHFPGTQQQIAFAWNVLTNTGDLNFKSAIQSDYAFYGLGVLLPAYALSYAIDVILLGQPHTFYQSFTPILSSLAFGCALATSWFVARLVQVGTKNAELSIYAGLSLALIPPWTGYGFIDYKDIPIALGVASCVYFCAAYADRKDSRYLTSFFVALLFLGSQRLAALALVLPACCILAIVAVRQNAWFGLKQIMAHSAAFALLLYGLTPPAWRQPLAFASESFALAAQFPFTSCTLTAGECIGRNYAGGDGYSVMKYLGLWYLVQMPLMLLIGALAAISFYLRSLVANLRGLTEHLLVKNLVVISIVWPIIGMVWQTSTLYNGIRHTLFLVPLIVAFFFLCVPAAFILGRRYWFIGYGLFLLADSVAIHPYGYVWFNEPSRFFVNGTNYFTDYWYYSSREAARRLKSIAPPGSYVAAGPEDLVLPLVDENFRKVRQAELPKESSYFLLVPPNLPPSPSTCRVVDTISRHQLFAPELLTLSFLAKCHR